MGKVMSLLKKKGQKGATMVEYAIMVAVFAILLIGAVQVMRGAVRAGFIEVCEKIQVAVPDITCTEEAAPAG